MVNPSLVTPDLTESWEKDLEAIAAGKKQAGTFLNGIEKETKRLVNEIKSSKQEYQDFSITQKKCPECGANLREKTHVTAKSMSAPIQIATTAEEKIQKSLIIDARNVTGKWKSSKVKRCLFPL